MSWCGFGYLVCWLLADLPGSVLWRLLVILDNSWPLWLQIFLLVSYLSSLSRIQIIHILHLLKFSHIFFCYILFFSFSILFLLCISVCKISTDLCSSSLVLSSAMSSLQSSLKTSFFLHSGFVSSTAFRFS